MGFALQTVRNPFAMLHRFFLILRDKNRCDRQYQIQAISKRERKRERANIKTNKQTMGMS